MEAQKYAKDLKKGDLIIIAYQNYLQAAIYLDDKGRGNPRFHQLNTNLIWMKQNYKERGKLYKDYIIRPTNHIIAKLSPNALSDEEMEKYLDLKDFLTEIGEI